MDQNIPTATDGEEPTQLSPEVLMLRNNKQDGYDYRQRRHAEWDENYELSRDRVHVNRFNQRQMVTLPVMKQTQRTLLAQIDDMPVLYFEDLGNDKDREIFKNEYWKYTQEQNDMEIQDVVDKKQVFHFGRSFDQWQIMSGKVVQTICDPMDIEVSRYVNPYNIHSSRFLIHNHIFMPLETIKENDDYNEDEVQKLEMWFTTEQGIIKSATNRQMLQEKNQKLADMGVQNIDTPTLGETYVELSLHFVYRKEEGDDEEQIYMYVECEDMHIIMKKPLEEVIGITEDHFWRNHYPYVTWADDVERQDFWSDGIADIVRMPAKIINSWFSQEVENRTLQNFNMHYYASDMEGFNPQSFEPTPWGWYPIPLGTHGSIEEILKTVDVKKLDGNLEDMNYVISMTEKATGSTPTLQGAATENKITLGEVQLALGQAKQRIKGISKFYNKAWADRGLIFVKLIEAAGDKLEPVKIYKKGRNTDNIYAKEISYKDWKSKVGYRCKVWSQDDKNEHDQMSLQKWDAARQNMPGNPVLEEIYKRKLVEFAGATPDEIKSIMDFEKQRMNAMQSMQNTLPPGPGGVTTPIGGNPMLPQPAQVGGVQ